MADSGITKEFLEETLKCSIDRFEVKPGSEIGDNYACILLSVSVWKSGSEDPEQIMVKCYPNQPARQQFLESSNIFLIEVGTYNEVIPELYKFQEELQLPAVIEPPFAKFIAAKNLDAEERKGKC